MNPALLLSAAVLATLLQGLSGQTSKVPEKVPPTATISGRVVTSEGAPLKSARVVLVPEQKTSGSPQVYSGMSDADGKFNIKGIPAGRYRFFASHNGYVDQQFQSAGTEKGAVLALRSGEEVKDVLFRMTLAAVITGRVDDEDGEPMTGIQVVALKRPSEDEREDNPWLVHSELATATGGQTDDRGQYRLFGLKAGEYYIRAIDQFIPPMMMAMASDDWALHESLGSQYAPVYYPGVTQIGQAEAVLVRSGEEGEADFTLRRVKTVEVSGKVVTVDGKPGTNCYVGLIETPATESSLNLNASPDSKGEFKIRGVPPGSYLLIAEEDSGGGEQRHRAQEKIELGEDNLESIALFLGRGSKVSGHVTVEAGTVNTERLFVSLVSPDEIIPGGWCRVKKDGWFEIADVADGSFRFDFNGLEEGYYVRSARVGRDDILTNGLQIEKGQTGGTIQVVVANSTAQLEGAVTQNGAAVVGARVRVSPVPETPYNRMRARSTRTDQGGRFNFSAIAPGKYKVVAKFSGPDGAKPPVSDPQTLDILENEHRQIELTVVSPDK
ncbi:MAG TPA: carboxypeptidase regulatory-like domain-containing protein [Terriglobales bacterium]|nr:carboxypeptidase regulatory-like domain-containing protein [Terriglobales bacterium]